MEVKEEIKNSTTIHFNTLFTEIEEQIDRKETQIYRR